MLDFIPFIRLTNLLHIGGRDKALLETRSIFGKANTKTSSDASILIASIPNSTIFVFW